MKPSNGMKYFLLTVCWGIIFSASAAGEPDSLMGKLPPHPRLILTPENGREVTARLRSGDQWSNRMMKRIRHDAEALRKEPPCRMVLSSNRQLLKVSREVLRRVVVLGMVWRLDRDKAAGQRLLAELDAAAEAADWNPTHFLDTAEMTLAMALGYDWGYDLMTPEQRQRIAGAIIGKGLKAALGHAGGRNTANNWNQVRHGGLTAGALAVYEEAPAEAATVLRQARENYRTALDAYGRDGVYVEGPTYWAYGTTFSVVMAACLESATGSDWDISRHPGLIASFEFILQVTAPSGRMFNYADSSEELDATPAHMWLAAKQNNPRYAAYACRLTAGDMPTAPKTDHRLAPLALLWYRPFPKTVAEETEPTVWSGGDRVRLAILRTPGNSKRPAAFAGFKGGIIPVNHGHMDVGSFVYEALGERWSSDLGADSAAYANPRFFDLDQSSRRWNFFRINNFSHSTLTLGGAPQQVAGNNPLAAGKTSDGQVGAVVDLAAAYRGRAATLRRGLKLFPSGTLLVEDEFTGLRPTDELRWNMMTAAEIALSVDRREAVLTRNGKRLTVRILSPAGAVFEILSARPATDRENLNQRYRRLSTVLPPPVADGTLKIMLQPGDVPEEKAETVPPSQWQLKGKTF